MEEIQEEETNKTEENKYEQPSDEELQLDNNEEENKVTSQPNDDCERIKTHTALSTGDVAVLLFLSLTVVGLLAFGIAMVVKKCRQTGKTKQKQSYVNNDSSENNLKTINEAEQEIGPV